MNENDNVTYRGAKKLQGFYAVIQAISDNGPQPVPLVVVACMSLALVHVLDEDDSEDALVLSAFRELPPRGKALIREACERFQEAVR